jgi:hypothetical protein
VLLFVPVELVPIVGGLFASLERRAEWATDSDFMSGYQAMAALEAQLMSDCLGNLIQEIRDARGVLPDFVATPVIDRTSDMYRSFNDIIQATFDSRGVLVDGWFTDTTATLADVVRAMRGSDSGIGATLWSDVKDLLTAGAEVSSILSFITGFLDDQEQTVVEGGLLITEVALLGGIAGILDNISRAQTTQQLAFDAILTALRGETAPTDNILEAIRGDTVSDADRNVVDLLS